MIFIKSVTLKTGVFKFLDSVIKLLTTLPLVRGDWILKLQEEIQKVWQIRCMDGQECPKKVFLLPREPIPEKYEYLPTLETSEI